MATVKGKLKTQTGDILYPETSADKVVGLGATIIELEEDGSTTAGTWKAKTNAITALVDGQVFLYKIAVAGAATTTLTITANGTSLGAKTVYRVGTTKLTTQYPVGHYLLLVYNSLNTCFRVVNDSDANSYALVRQYQYGANSAGSGTKRPLLARYNTTNNNGSYDTAYTKYHTDTTLDTSNGYLYAPKVYSGGKEVVVTDDSRLSDSRPASDVSEWAKASTKPSYSWSEITDKPAVAEDGVKALYHLGEYDTVDTSNADYDLITRQTFVVDLDSLNWNWTNQGTYGYWQSSDTVDKNALDIPAGNYSYNGSFKADGVATYKGAYQMSGDETSYSMGINVDGIVFAVNQSTTEHPTGKLCIKLKTPYTEKVIKDRPLTTLDARGSSWLRNEYEKGLNLASHVVANYVGTDRVGYRVADSLPAGTYTLKIYNGSGNVYLWTSEHRGDQFTNNKTITFTLSSASPVEVNVSDGSGTTTNCLFMLNEGPTSLAYVPYSGGKIVRDGDMGVLLWENANPTADIAEQNLPLALPSTDFKYLIIEAKIEKSADQSKQFFKVRSDLNDIVYLSFIDSGSARRYHRFGIIYQNNFTISTGYVEGAANNDGACVPVAIYGTNIL